MKANSTALKSYPRLFTLPKIKYQIPADKLIVREKKTIRLVDKNQIIYCQSDSNYTKIFLCTGEKILISKCLKELAINLRQPNFIRIHASYLINLDYLEKINYSSSKYVQLIDKIELPISRSRFKDLITIFENKSGK